MVYGLGEKTLSAFQQSFIAELSLGYLWPSYFPFCSSLLAPYSVSSLRERRARTTTLENLESECPKRRGINYRLLRTVLTNVFRENRDKQAFNDWKGYMTKETNGDRDSPASLTPSGRMVAEIPTHSSREADL